MDPTQCMTETLQKMVHDGIKTIEIYYCEIIEDKVYWSVDIMNNIINDKCKTQWTWSIISKAEDDEYREEYNDDADLDDYEVVVDQKFSDIVVCNAVQSWLLKNDIHGLEVKMIDYIDGVPYSGYIKDLMERDLDEEMVNSIPLEEL